MGELATALDDSQRTAIDGQPDLPVLLMSGFDRPDGRAGIAPGTVYEFIQKPFHMRELVERLSSMMPAAPHKQTNS